MDGRRRRWFAFSADFPFDRAGTAIYERFGLEGLAVWVCFLAACKRNGVQGQVTYTTDAEGWSILGVAPAAGFTLTEFFVATGRLKVTKRRVRARLITVTATGWDDWQHPSKTRTTETRKTSVTAQNTRDLGTSNRDNDSHIDNEAKLKFATMRKALRTRTGKPATMDARNVEAELLATLPRNPDACIAGDYDGLIEAAGLTIHTEVNNET